MPTAKVSNTVYVPDEEFLTSKEVADLIGWSEGSLRVARSKGRDSGMRPPPGLKRGRRVMYYRTHLIQWLNRQGYRFEYRGKPKL